MPSVDIPGKITAIEYEDDAVNFDIVSLSAARPPTIIEPTGKPVTIVLASNTDPNPIGFQMDGSFEIGDIVEILGVDLTTGGFSILDENGSGIASINGLGSSVICRKVRDGSTFPTWLRVYSS